MTSYWEGDNASVFIPSNKWASASEFFAVVKPPFFEEYEIIVADPSKGDNDCYNYSYLLKATFLCLMGLFLNLM